MISASSSITPRKRHLRTFGGQSEIAGLEFTMFAETLRQDLAPSSLIEHVLTERVVVAAWRLHVEAVRDAEAASEGTILDPLDCKSARSESALKSSLALLKSARKGQERWGCSDHTTTRLVEPSLTSVKAGDEADTDDGFDPGAVDLSNEWPYIADVENEDVEPEAVELDEESDIPVRWQDRLVFDFNVSETSPVVKGTWITVGHVVSLIVDGWSWADVLRSHPELCEDDVRTCLAYTVEQDDRGEF